MSSIKLKGYPSFPNIYYDTFGNKLIISSNLKSENSYKSPSIFYFLKTCTILLYIHQKYRILDYTFNQNWNYYHKIMSFSLFQICLHKYRPSTTASPLYICQIFFIKIIAIIFHRYLGNCSKNNKDFCQTNLSSFD